MTGLVKSRKYEQASKLARPGREPSHKVYDLISAAHEEGDMRATYALATWYLFGNRYCKKNYRTASALLRKAADAGIPEAVYDLAVSNETGKGAKKSLRNALRLYIKAALLGDAQSHHEVGRMYFHGLGVARDRALADIWFAKAETLGVTE